MSGLSSAQVLKGEVVDGESGKALSMVAVYNSKSQQYVYTDVAGRFSISAEPGAIISFSCVGYKTQTKVVPVSEGTATMHIDLFKLSYELDEFVYHPLYTPYQMDSMERKSTYQRALARERVKSVMSPVTLLADLLSKKSKQIYRFQKNFNYWETMKFIESRYSPELVTQMTGLKGDTAAYFINANPMPYDYARVASDLELKMWIREHYREWIKHPEFEKMPQATDSTAVQSK